jgi:hypothetical protein
MNDIHQVPAHTPKAAQPKEGMPFEIIIRTTDQEYLDHGAPPELSEKAVGYFCVVSGVDGSTVYAQGSLGLAAIVAHMLSIWDAKEIALAAIAMAAKKDRKGREGGAE